MSKFIKVTLVGQTDQMLVNVDQIKEVEIDAEGSSILVKDGYYLIVSEEIDQIEAQLLRDEFAMRSMQAIQNSLVIPEGKTGFDQAAYDCTIAESAYEMADAMLKERLK